MKRFLVASMLFVVAVAAAGFLSPGAVSAEDMKLVGVITKIDIAGPDATTATKTAISFTLSTLRRMIISGSDKAITDIMKARTVPRAAPLPSSASTTGMMPAAFEYIGTPSSTAAGTDHQASAPMIRDSNSAGT